MRAQLERLVASGDLPNVSIRIVPFSVGFQRGVLSGPFTILRFPQMGDGRASEPPTVHVDGFTGELYLDKPGEIAHYMAAFTSILAASLTDAASKEFIHNAAKELPG